jgi:hypothetical protein
VAWRGAGGWNIALRGSEELISMSLGMVPRRLRGAADACHAGEAQAKAARRLRAVTKSWGPHLFTVRLDHRL